MSFLEREYEIPFFGKVELIKATGYDKSFNGNYYAKNNHFEKFAKKSESVEELIEKTSNKVKDYLEKQVTLSEQKINNEKEKKEKLELILEKVNDLKNPKEVEEWLKEYQTDNPLQLEIQSAEKQKGVKFKWEKE
jgi:hypothetical protein